MEGAPEPDGDGRPADRRWSRAPDRPQVQEHRQGHDEDRHAGVDADGDIKMDPGEGGTHRLDMKEREGLLPPNGIDEEQLFPEASPLHQGAVHPWQPQHGGDDEQNQDGSRDV